VLDNGRCHTSDASPAALATPESRLSAPSGEALPRHSTLVARAARGRPYLYNLKPIVAHCGLG